MSPIHSAKQEEPGSKSQQRMRRYLWLSRTAFALGIGGFLAILLGILCFPSAVTNPEVMGSFFVTARASGWFLVDSRNLFAIGGFLAACGSGLWLAVRTAFNLPLNR
jgi:hypothetical protein